MDRYSPQLPPRKFSSTQMLDRRCVPEGTPKEGWWGIVEKRQDKARVKWRIHKGQKPQGINANLGQKIYFPLDRA